jgi:hypothetical protein
LKDEWCYHWCTYAAEAGYLEVMQWLCEKGNCKVGNSAKKTAAKVGHIHVLQWLEDDIKASMYNLCTDAARCGQLHVLKGLVQLRQKDPGIYTWFEAVRCGQVNVLHWAFTQRWICQSKYCANMMLDLAIENGRVNVLDWIRTVYPSVTLDERTWIKACEFEQLESMMWIRRNLPACPAPPHVWLDAHRRQLCGGRMIIWLRANFEHPID